MKIIIVGASGNVGAELVKALSSDHEIIKIGATSGDIQCDYTDIDSVRSMFEKVGEYDALVCVAGRDSIFKNFEDLTDDDYRYGFERKFLGQLRLLTLGQNTMKDRGCFVLSSGYLNDYPVPSSIATGPLNAAIDTLVSNTSPLLTRGLRINVVSAAPIVPAGSEGTGLVTAAEVAKSYIEALEGDFSGKVLRPWGGLPLVS